MTCHLSKLHAATCRDAASCELELSTLEEMQKGFEQACFSAGGQEIYGPLVDAVARTAAWLRKRAEGADIRQRNDSGKRFEGVCGALEVTLGTSQRQLHLLALRILSKHQG